MIKNSAAQSGASVLISSHIASDLQQICAKAAIIKSARLWGIETMPNIIQNHGSLENFYIDTVKINLEENNA
jgi:ABC-type multidrug transport system ATPase subunit